jgi:hypothetical protein
MGHDPSLKQANPHPVFVVLRNMPVADALTQISLYVTHALSELQGSDMIHDGIEVCLKEMAEEDAASWSDTFASDAAAYRAMQVGTGR